MPENKQPSDQNRGATLEVGTRGKHFSLSQPLRRSPALERAQQAIKQTPTGRRPRSQVQHGVSGRKQKITFAAEDVLAPTRPLPKPLPQLQPLQLQPQQPQPQLQVKLERASVRAPITASKRRRAISLRRKGGGKLVGEQPKPMSAPLQIMSNEEQKKLASLEMRLSRVAGKFDSVLLIVVLALLCIGLVMVYSASSFIAARQYDNPAYFFEKQLLGAILGIVVMCVLMNVDYRVWRRFSLWGLAIGVPLLGYVLFWGVSAYGASRWIGFGSFFSFQPGELIKLVLALYIADWLARKGSHQVGTFLYGLAPFVILVGLILGLVLLQNDMGTACVIAALAAAMFFTAGANILQFLLAMACGILIFLTQALHGYRYVRLIGFLHPFSDVTGINLQLYQSLLGLGSGGWLGIGLGASRQKTGWLPLPYIDSIFAVIGEELGYIGCIAIISLFLVLAFRGFRLARRTQDIYGALLATGITTWIVVQAMINIGATVGAIPYTGVPLPFISFGGTSLVVSLAAIGVLLSISRYIRQPDVPVLSRQTIDMVRKKRLAEKSS